MQKEMTLTLPIPDRKLSPNARVHWAVKMKITKSHRAHARLLASQHDGCLEFESYRLVYYWPDKRKRDHDGAISRCKAYLDGVADAIGQDDSEWKMRGIDFGIPDKQHPRVEIVFTLKQDAE